MGHIARRSGVRDDHEGVARAIGGHAGHASGADGDGNGRGHAGGDGANLGRLVQAAWRGEGATRESRHAGAGGRERYESAQGW